MGHLSRACPDNPKGLYADGKYYYPYMSKMMIIMQSCDLISTLTQLLYSSKTSRISLFLSSAILYTGLFV